MTNDESKLPFAPSPAEETAIKGTICECGTAKSYHDENGRVEQVGCTGYRPRYSGNPPPPKPLPEPVSTEGAMGWAAELEAGRKIAREALARGPAPIAPAAVSDALRKLANEIRGWLDLEPIRLAGILGNTNVAVMRDRLALAESALAKPSAEGDGWIAPAAPETVRVISTVSRYIGLTEDQTDRLLGCLDVLRLKLVPAPPSGQGEKR